ncbi:cupredoxin domain-containing protein [Mycolicibacterium wolinskyi]|uniref:cupredoxin domain-containing protein n=1 Tax=Mycolicibacterium wolinskyi TaxID=59750 RepID=UPI0039178CE0
MKLMAVFCTLAGLLTVLVACGQSDDSVRGTGTAILTASPTTEPAPDGPTITIEGMGFSGGLTVAPGTQITIVNNDEVEHSVTARTGDAFDVHVDGKQRATLTAPSEPGEYAFYCVYHPAMIGTLTVS